MLFRFELITFIILFFQYVAESKEENSRNDKMRQLEQELQRIKDIYSKENYISFLEKDISLFLQSVGPPRDSERNILKQINNYQTSKYGDHQRDMYIIPDKLLEEYETLYFNGELETMIKKELGIEDQKYSNNYEFYGYPHKIILENYLWPILIDSTAYINEYSSLNNIISIEPEIINIERQICIPTSMLLKIKNLNKKNMIIRGVKCDLYQVKLFLYKNGKENLANINTHFPRTISPNDEIYLQLIILPDRQGVIKGSLYVELNDKKVLIIPIMINSVENPYRVLPIYFQNWTGGKIISLPISIYNPNSKVLIIKEVTHSFSNINLLWPNGVPVTNNSTAVSTSMLEVPSKKTKNIIYIKYYKENSCIEYGLLHLKTAKDILIVPILMKIEMRGIKTFPSYFNFGLIDLKSSIKRVIPFTVKNVSKVPLLVKPLYGNYDEFLVSFIMNDNITVLYPGDNVLLGYGVFDPLKYDPEIHENDMFKVVKGTFFIETNYTTPSAFGEIGFEYFLDKATFSNQLLNDSLMVNDTKKNQKIKSIDFVTKIKSPLNLEITALPVQGQEKKMIKIYHDNDMKIYVKSNQVDSKFNNIHCHVKILSSKTLMNKKMIVFPIKLSQNFYSILPVNIYDNNLEFLYCKHIHEFNDCYNSNNYTHFQSIHKYNTKTVQLFLNLGTISSEDIFKETFFIINDNNQVLNITDIETDHAAMTISLVGYETLDQSQFQQNNQKMNNQWESGRLSRAMKKKLQSKEKDKEKLKIMMYPNSIGKFEISVHSTQESGIKGHIHLYVDDSLKITFILTATVFKGNLNLTPSIIRFEPAFPGLFQSKFVSSKSSYENHVKILSARSTDQRIIPELLSNTIIPNNRTEIMRITFDPSQIDTEQNFMRGNYTMTNQTDIVHSYLTYKELYLWKEKQKLWEQLGSEGRTEINAVIKIKTSIQKEDVHVRAFLTKPSLVKKDEILFGLVQIGKTISTYIEGFNPSDETIYYQILLATEEFGDIHNNSMFDKNQYFKFNSANQVNIFDCQFYNSSVFDSTSSIKYNFSSSKKNKKKRKNNLESILNIDKLINPIIIEEDLDYDAIKNQEYPKDELLKKLFLFSNSEMKKSFISATKIVCNSHSITKNSIVLNNYTSLSENIFSSEFNEEIKIIKQMTEQDGDFIMKNSNDDSNHKVKKRILNYLTLLFQFNQNSSNKDNELPSQVFFLPKSVSAQTYYIKPHQKFKIGPIMYHPTTFIESSATLFIKNNLTILYPIKLQGKGGSGIPKFFTSKPISPHLKLIDNKLIIEIDRDVFDNEMFDKSYIVRKVILSNIGTLPLKIVNISIEHSTCENFGIKLSHCSPIELSPKENIELQLEIRPDFNFYITEKELFFESEYHSTSLKVVINIHQDLLMMKNKLFNYDYMKSYGFLSLFISVIIGLSILKIMTLEKNHIRNFLVEKISLITDNEDINQEIKFANLLIKSYRKDNMNLFDDFINKQIDKPGSVDIETITSSVIQSEKRKIKKKLKSPKTTLLSGSGSNNASDVPSHIIEKTEPNELSGKKEIQQQSKEGGRVTQKIQKITKAKPSKLPDNTKVDRHQCIDNQTGDSGSKNRKQSTQGISSDNPIPSTITNTTDNQNNNTIYTSNPGYYNKTKNFSTNPGQKNSNYDYNTSINYNPMNSQSHKLYSNTTYGNNNYYQKKQQQQNQPIQQQYPQSDSWKNNNNNDINPSQYFSYDYYQQNHNNKPSKNKFNIIPSNLSCNNLPQLHNPSISSNDKDNDPQPHLIQKKQSNEIPTSLNLENQGTYLKSHSFKEEKPNSFLNDIQSKPYQDNQIEHNTPLKNLNIPLIEPDDQSQNDDKDKSPFIDFTDMFEKKSIDQPYDNDDIFIGQHSEKENKILDSGPDDVKYSINNIIGGINMKMGVCFSGNEQTDEDVKSNKPYFANIINNTNFENKFYYSNPFTHQNNKGALTELINEEDDNDIDKSLEKDEDDNNLNNDDEDYNDNDKNNSKHMDIYFNYIN